MNKALYVDSISSVAGRLSVPRLLPPILKVLQVWLSWSHGADGCRSRRYVSAGYVLSPLVAMVPPYATAGALIFVAY